MTWVDKLFEKRRNQGTRKGADSVIKVDDLVLVVLEKKKEIMKHKRKWNKNIMGIPFPENKAYLQMAKELIKKCEKAKK